MIYLVTLQQELFENSSYEIISIEESLEEINSWSIIQFDTETDGKDAHINHLLLAQFGSPDGKTQIVVDCATIDIIKYKSVSQSLVLGQTKMQKNKKLSKKIRRTEI